MKRKIYQDLLEWKEKDARKVALLIDGARRVGKSWIAEEFGRNEYESYLLIDFSKAAHGIRTIFEEHLGDIDTFFMLLEAVKPADSNFYVRRHRLRQIEAVSNILFVSAVYLVNLFKPFRKRYFF